MFSCAGPEGFTNASTTDVPDSCAIDNTKEGFETMLSFFASFFPRNPIPGFLVTIFLFLFILDFFHRPGYTGLALTRYRLPRACSGVRPFPVLADLQLTPPAGW